MVIWVLSVTVVVCSLFVHSYIISDCDCGGSASAHFGCWESNLVPKTAPMLLSKFTKVTFTFLLSMTFANPYTCTADTFLLLWYVSATSQSAFGRGPRPFRVDGTQSLGRRRFVLLLPQILLPRFLHFATHLSLYLHHHPKSL